MPVPVDPSESGAPKHHASPAFGRGGAPRPQRRGGPDDGRRRRGGDRHSAGFGDEIERAFCLSFVHTPPPDFPVQHRTGIATLRPLVVGRRPGALLLCDSSHPGAHRWPDGEEAEAGHDAGDAT